MEVNERLEQETPVEIDSEVADVPAPLATPPTPEEEEPAPAAPSWLRLAYSLEFLIAVIAVLMLWTQVSGQGHMDLLPWYTKLACVLSMAWFAVRFTMSAVEQPKGWNRHSVLWFTGILLLAAIMGGIVYYYHLHEATDDTDTEDSTAALVWKLPTSHDQSIG